VDVQEGLPEVAIPGDVLHELLAHAREACPEECCGLIVGDASRRFRRVVRCRNEMSQRNAEDPVTFPLDNRSGFYMSPEDYRQAQEQAEAAGERVTAVYHSHVDTGAYLSADDLEYAESELFPFPEADQLVVSVHDDREHPRVVAVAIFQREEVGKPFVGRRVASPGR
jgi:proteasome lid subunit RPN8/RPN11